MDNIWVSKIFWGLKFLGSTFGVLPKTFREWLLGSNQLIVLKEMIHSFPFFFIIFWSCFCCARNGVLCHFLIKKKFMIYFLFLIFNLINPLRLSILKFLTQSKLFISLKSQHLFSVRPALPECILKVSISAMWSILSFRILRC